MNRFSRRVLLCVVLFSTTAAIAQDIPPSNQFSRKNTYTLFAEYSNTSSKILLGAARQRKLADFGGGYTRRVVRFWGSDLGYHVEVRPVLFESDPIDLITTVYQLTTSPYTSVTQKLTTTPGGECIPSSVTIPFGEPNETQTTTITCGRQWTFGQAFSPIGFKYSLRTRHPLQPFILGTLGYMYTSRPVPVAAAEAFNFFINFGAGIELYKSRTNRRSVSVECLWNHFSNRDTAEANPGTDNIMYKVSYSFGR